MDADLHTRPEDAKDSICPFLRPIKEVYSLHQKKLPQWAGQKALGCMLMEDKPLVCRLSPLARSSGMVTGKVTYEYPKTDCPACESSVDMRVSSYVSSVLSSDEQAQEERFHRLLMAYNAHSSSHINQERFNKIIKHIYNIDGLLSQYGIGTEERPPLDYLVEMVMRARKGDFSLWENFIDGLGVKMPKE